jgi:hypothetical protein
MDDLALIRDFAIDADLDTTSARAAARQALEQRLGGGRSWFRRPAALVVVAALAAAIAGGAFALTQLVFVGSPAPLDVRAQVEFDAGVKETLASHAATTGVIVAETTAAAVLETASGPAYLWVAPTVTGGECQFLDFANDRQPNGAPNLSGGCSLRHTRPIDATFSWTRVQGHPVALVYGYAKAPATRIVVHFASGAEKITPVTTHHFMIDVPAGDGPGDADQVVSVDSVDAHGSVIGTQMKPQLGADGAVISPGADRASSTATPRADLNARPRPRP